MISVKDSLILGCVFRDVSLRNKSGLSICKEQQRELEIDSMHLSILEKYLDDVKLDEFFEELEIV